MIYNKDIAELTALHLVELLKKCGISASMNEYKSLKEYGGFESRKARNIGHTDAIRVIVGNHSADFFVLENGTLCTGSTFMSSDAVSFILYEFTEVECNPFPELFWENGVRTFEDKNDPENGAAFFALGKLREWFARWQFVAEETAYEPF